MLVITKNRLSVTEINSSPAVQEQPFTWSVFQNNKNFGPYSRSDVLKLILSKQIVAQAKLKRSDWQDFKPVIDCLELISQPQNYVAKPKLTERRMAAPRTPVNGIAKASNEQTAIACIASNLSTTGIFLKTGETCFRIGEKIELVAKVDQMSKPFMAKAEVMRFSTNLKFGVGYGLKFVSIENSVIGEIRNLVGVRPISEFGDFLSSPSLKAAKS